MKLKKVLIVEGSITSSLFTAGEIKKQLEVDAVTSKNAEELRTLLDKERFGVALFDPELYTDGGVEMLQLITSHGIPVIIYSAAEQEKVAPRLLDYPIVEWITKSVEGSLDTVIQLCNQLLKHRSSKVMVVDDSQTIRMLYSEYLEQLNLEIILAEDAEEAMLLLNTHTNVKLVVSDYQMPGMNGVELTREIRKRYNRKELCIIGVSAHGGGPLSVDFLKNGANDFIAKPFLKEELINRVLINLDILDYIAMMQDATYRDFLTKIHNRKYVFETGAKLFENAKRGSITLACAMLDIDHFKKINDTYGHDVGDLVIIRVAEELEKSFRRSDIVGRIGGEEFCVILSNPNLDNLEEVFETLRAKIEQSPITIRDEAGDLQTIRFTVSIGVTATLAESLDGMLKFADQKLYEAKNYGRNLVVL